VPIVFSVRDRAQSNVGPATVLSSRARQQRSHTGPSLSRCVLVCLSILGQGWKPAKQSDFVDSAMPCARTPRSPCALMLLGSAVPLH
jgi:hypothetical protein